jgi:hypothetical protein
MTLNPVSLAKFTWTVGDGSDQVQLTAANSHYGIGGSGSTSRAPRMPRPIHWNCSTTASRRVPRRSRIWRRRPRPTSPSGAARRSFGFTWGGEIDECYVDNVAHSTAQDCRITNCQLDGTLCACDGAAPTTYRACATNSDCQLTTALCDPTSSTCRGRAAGTCTGGTRAGRPCFKTSEATDCTGGGACTACTPSACNAAAP